METENLSGQSTVMDHIKTVFVYILNLIYDLITKVTFDLVILGSGELDSVLVALLPLFPTPGSPPSSSTN